ncbi:hypothetical protein ACIGNX_13150 [Actinosynnema sp. NPDC053489]|uniref:hypothetical protein n=1 Tax=Actinosynnema sp. NPDC053489 TaxID=3363916 RepID=UPI0037CBD1AB
MDRTVGAIRFWDVRAARDLPAALCATARRTLTTDEWARHLPGAEFIEVCPTR